MSWYASLAAWSVLIRVFEIDSVDDNNDNDNNSLQKWQVNSVSDLLQLCQVNNNKSDNNEDKICLFLRC